MRFDLFFSALPAFVLALVGCLATEAASAQPATLLRVEFEFSNPGARSLAFGGAFAALADDATAAYANPAGLGQLIEPELSLELRSWQRSVPFLEGGRVDGEPTGQGLDVEPSPLEGRARDKTTDVSFASYVHPRGRWSFGLYYHQLARFEVETEAQGQFFEIVPGATARFPATRERLDLDITTLGLSACWNLDDHWSVGLGVAWLEGGGVAQTELYFPFLTGGQDLFSPVSFTPDELDARFDATIDTTDLALRFGLRWQPNDRWAAAAVFRQGARLEGLLTRASVREDAVSADTVPTAIEVPSVWGLGISRRALDGRLTIAFEFDRSDAGPLFEVEPDDEASFSAEEYHFGAEYAFVVGRRLFALRGGVWHDSRPRGLLDDSGTWHTALGVGLAGKVVQFDIGVDFSDFVDTYAISTVYRF